MALVNEKAIGEYKLSLSKKINKWSKMVVDPTAQAVHAPRVLPGITCVSRIAKSVDIPYADTVGGYVTVVVSPKASAAYYQTLSGDFPSAGRERLFGQTTKATPLNIPKGNAVARTGAVELGLGNSTVSAVTTWIKDLDVYFPGLSSWSGMSWDAAQNVQIILGFRVGFGTYVRPYLVDSAGNKIDQTQIYCPPNAWAMTTVTTPNAGNTTQMVGFYMCNNNGVQLVMDNDVNVDFTIEGNAQVRGAQGAPSSIVKSELLEQGGVTHISGTSCQMLVTNLASQFDGAGEVVMARTHAGILGSGSTKDIMDAIKSLPEKNYWRSGNLLNGGYAWYLPDDVDSYEPKPLHTDHSDNVLIAGIKMANSAGQVRINCTWTFEYYTTFQAISRSPGIGWNDEAKEAYSILLSKSACSENPGHAALIAGVMAGATALHTFYKENSGWIDPIARRAAEVVVKKALGPSKKKPMPPPPPVQKRGKKQ